MKGTTLERKKPKALSKRKSASLTLILEAKKTWKRPTSWPQTTWWRGQNFVEEEGIEEHTMIEGAIGTNATGKETQPSYILKMC